MKAPHTVGLVAFMALVGFLAWLAQEGDNDEKLYIGLIGTVMLIGLIGLLAALARSLDENREKIYFTAIGTLIGLVGGLVGGAAIGNQAGKSAADDVKD